MIRDFLQKHHRFPQRLGAGWRRRAYRVKIERMRLLIVAFLSALPLAAAAPTPPVRGLHLSAPSPDDLPLALRFIREGLAKEGVNVLVMEFNYRYQFTKRPEVADANALSAEQVKA